MKPIHVGIGLAAVLLYTRRDEISEVLPNLNLSQPIDISNLIPPTFGDTSMMLPVVKSLTDTIQWLSASTTEVVTDAVGTVSGVDKFREMLALYTAGLTGKDESPTVGTLKPNLGNKIGSLLADNFFGLYEGAWESGKRVGTKNIAPAVADLSRFASSTFDKTLIGQVLSGRIWTPEATTGLVGLPIGQWASSLVKPKTKTVIPKQTVGLSEVSTAITVSKPLISSGSASMERLAPKPTTYVREMNAKQKRFYNRSLT